MSEYQTEFGSIERFEKGHLEIIDDEPKHYVFSNVFEVASRAAPYQKTAVARNLDYVIEAIRAEGVSPWMAAPHDEFVVVMDGKVRVELVKLDHPEALAPPSSEGTVPVPGEPSGRRMGRIVLGRGHQALLPAGCAYRFEADSPSVMIQQTLRGPLTVERWAEICLS
jgi:hypothetical protein